MTDSETAVFLGYLAAVLGGIALFAGVLTVVAIRLRKAADAESLAMRAATVLAECRALLVGPEFLWGVWHDTAKAAAMRMLIRDARDVEVTTINRMTMPFDGVLQHFELDGRRYEIRKASPLSNRTVLREAGRDTVLLSADHAMRGTEVFRGDGAASLCVMPSVSVFRRFRPVNAGGVSFGRVIVGLKGNAFATVMSMPVGRCSVLEQVFLIASL